MINESATPQEARQVLPNALKTEICMTGFASDWKHFFDLRYYGKTGKPHPDMLQLATLMKEEADKHGIWNEISNSNK
jgi:thymidylate synthase (FAD)